MGHDDIVDIHGKKRIGLATDNALADDMVPCSITFKWVVWLGYQGEAA
jgi:hypothetical protein